MQCGGGRRRGVIHTSEEGEVRLDCGRERLVGSLETLRPERGGWCRIYRQKAGSRYPAKGLTESG